MKTNNLLPSYRASSANRFRSSSGALLLLFALAFTAHAKPGDLDPAYGHSGIATATFNSYSTLGGAALQADGKLVIVGTAEYFNGGNGNTADAPFVARFNTDGTLDTSFGTNGFVVTRFPIANQPSDVHEGGAFNGVVIQPDGKIIAAGGSQSNWCCGGFYSDPVLARYNPDGSLDASFGDGGKVFTNTGLPSSPNGVNGGARIYNLALAADGSFYAVGGDGDRTASGKPQNRPAMVLKYSSSGGLLRAAYPNFPATDANKHSTKAVLQPDGKLVINLNGGAYGSAPAIVDFVLMRFNPDLSVDKTFGNNGVVVTDFGTGTEQANGITLDPDGKITASGSSASSNGTGDCFVARYHPNGSLNRTFGNDGKVIIAPSQYPFAFTEGQSILRQPDGKYVIALGARYGGLGAIRLLGNGAIDTDFGTGGIANYQSQDPNSPYPTITGNGGGVLLQSDGKIILPATDANNVDALNGVKVLRLLNAGQLLNISTRVDVQTGDDVMIGGFIVTGTDAKKVAIRGIGPSLPVNGALQNPVIELHDGSGNVLATNDNWKINDASGTSQEAEVRATKIQPTNDNESFLLATLTANGSGYTVIVGGKNGSSGVGQFEVYDLSEPTASELANISTRGFVGSDATALIGGFTSGNGGGSSRVIVRALGPSLGVAGALQNPVLELHDMNGVVVASNNNWQQDVNAAQVSSAGLAPQDSRESALSRALPPAAYTAIVRGNKNTSGVALIEIYNLQ